MIVSRALQAAVTPASILWVILTARAPTGGNLEKTGKLVKVCVLEVKEMVDA